MAPEEIEKYRKAGSIARKVKEYAKKIIKPGVPLLEIAERIENKIIELGAKPGFPVSLSIDDIAAHSTPSYNDKTPAFGLLKIDLGVHSDGFIADTAFSMDLENSKENKKLIEAAEKALKEAIKIIKPGIEICEIGKQIQETISSSGFTPVRNLSGHQIDRYKIHAGITIPNYNNNNKNKLHEGIYAVEPFSTLGIGLVYEGKPSGIYALIEKKPVRDKKTREILKFIEEEYKTIPFCERWLINRFGTCSIFALKQLKQLNIIKEYPQLIEKSRRKVAQAEHTLLVAKEKVEILT